MTNTGTDLIPIRTLTLADVRGRITAALAGECDLEALNWWVMSVDWSFTDYDAMTPAMTTLGALELLLHEHEEGAISLSELKAELAHLLQEAPPPPVQPAR